MTEDGKFRIEKFDGIDFSWWKMQIEDFLVQKDFDVVLGDKPEKMSDADWASLDRKAMSVIRLSLTNNVAFNILKEKTAKGIMEALSNMYEKPSAANKVFLIRELVNTRMKKGTSITEHINKMNSALTRLVSVKIKFDDEVQALLLLSSLPDTWSGTVTAVTVLVGPDGFTFDQIQDLVLGEDVRRKSSRESSGELLHVCRGRRNSRGSVSEEEVTLTCCEESNVDSLVMDSGASFHATTTVKHCRIWLSETLERYDLRTIELLRKLDEQGHEVKFRDGQWKVMKENLVMAHGKKRGSLYMVELAYEGVTIPVQKRNKVWFIESRGQNKVVYAREKPRATDQTQDERARKGSRRPVRGICGSGSSRGASAKFPRRHWVRRTSIPVVGTSPEKFLLSMESVCSQDVPGSGSVCLQWEPVGAEDESGADFAVIDVLEFGRASMGLSVV
ncbi:unnamed protein product [Cuscuta campestris]|uniref:Retrovirus-related Pol polyprotein from transposon TNT 1-94 n=1 Tax=Cuscuta campestris TaxID=132261 RepID=A0A484MG88_9ASTE|nr:unnamed protein product [Cuscuta campestris]